METGMPVDTWSTLAQPRLPVSQYGSHSELNLGAWVDVLQALPMSDVTESDVLTWVEGPLRQFFPFEKFLGFYGKLFAGRVQILSLVTSGYPTEFISELGAAFDLSERACIGWWLSNGKPFILHQSTAWNEAGSPVVATSRELDEINRFSLGAIAAHGVVDRFVDACTYISFAGIPLGQPDHTFAALKLIAPVLHGLLLQTKQAKESPFGLLTGRQIELVDLAREGLSDKAIAKRLVISEHTVGNHFRAIYAKLGISKRSQLSIPLLK
jgi:DNA-binding CsgD family transcriptional regulator